MTNENAYARTLQRYSRNLGGRATAESITDHVHGRHAGIETRFESLCPICHTESTVA